MKTFHQYDFEIPTARGSIFKTIQLNDVVAPRGGGRPMGVIGFTPNNDIVVVVLGEKVPDRRIYPANQLIILDRPIVKSAA